jgi:RNA-directed DNA polymerase
MIRLIRKWLKAGVMDDGEWSASKAGTPQGAVVSPMLANIYLHHVFDLWAERWRHREAHGNVIYVRYADDVVAGFEHEKDAVRSLADLRERLEKFALSLHPDKTRLIEFGRHAADNRKKRGLGKPETFNFLGFTHICGRSRKGYFALRRKTRRDRMRMKLKALKEELHRRMHAPIPEQGRWLAQVVRGYFAYHAVPTNAQRLAAFRYHVTILWYRTLRRRSQKDWTKWERMARLAAAYLPPGTHPSPLAKRPLCRQTPEVGARCANRARRVLCGGRPVMGVPTAIINRADSALWLGSNSTTLFHNRVEPKMFKRSGPIVGSQNRYYVKGA